MIGIVDVHYEQHAAHAALVLARDWMDSNPWQESVASISQVADYEPGQFYRRELPCLIKILSSQISNLTTIVVDGYVWLDESAREGLGARLFTEISQCCPVIGVAKTKFHSAPAIEVVRGVSHRPLYVSAVGMESELAANLVKSMHGSHRIPTLIKRADQVARNLVEPNTTPIDGTRGM